jgi:hypothetical protein
VLPLPRSGSNSRQRHIPGQQASILNYRHNLFESILPPLQCKDTAMNQLDGTASAASISDSRCLGCGGGEHCLDGKSSESLSFLHQAQFELGSSKHQRRKIQSHSSSVLRSQRTGTNQTSRDSKQRSLGYRDDMGQQRRAPPYNMPPDTQLATQHAVQEALAASLSTAVSAGDENMVEIFKNMQGQMLRMQT